MKSGLTTSNTLQRRLGVGQDPVVVVQVDDEVHRLPLFSYNSEVKLTLCPCAAVYFLSVSSSSFRYSLKPTWVWISVFVSWRPSKR